MTQPLNRDCELPALGELDAETGEFWTENPFQTVRERRNLSSYERNRAFLNLGGNAFLDFSFASACDIDSDSRSVVAADFDRDGRTDLLVGSVGGGPLRLFRNEFSSKNNLVKLHLIGTKSNRPAIGTRVIAHCGNRKIVRDIFPANGCYGQGPPELILGTGAATVIDRLVIRWPTGKVQELRNVPVRGTIALTEGQSEARVSDRLNLPR